MAEISTSRYFETRIIEERHGNHAAARRKTNVYPDFRSALQRIMLILCSFSSRNVVG